MDMRAVWDMDAPTESRESFLALLETTKDPRLLLELRAQIARSFGLEGAFDSAHQILTEHWSQAMSEAARTV